MEESEEITGASAAPVNDNQWLKLSGVEKTDIEKAKVSVIHQNALFLAYCVSYSTVCYIT
jgi:hypothetical protein